MADASFSYARDGLQFGHGGDAVENPASMTNTVSGGTGLQFGHGGDAVENGSNAVAKSKARKGFNSATAVMPWRTASGTLYLIAHLELQFGHGGDAVENGGDEGRGWGCAGRFNSATAVMPWRTKIARDMIGTGPRLLQFGHGGDAVENDGLYPLVPRVVRKLQFGHGGDAVENGLLPQIWLSCALGASIRPRR